MEITTYVWRQKHTFFKTMDVIMKTENIDLQSDLKSLYIYIDVVLKRLILFESIFFQGLNV